MIINMQEQNTILEPNYIQLDSNPLLDKFRHVYLYIDTEEELITKALNECKSTMVLTFGLYFKKPGKKFVIKVIKCRPKYSKALTTEVFPALHKKMTVLYGQEYLDFCVTCANALIQWYEEKFEGKGDPSEIFSKRITE